MLALDWAPVRHQCRKCVAQVGNLISQTPATQIEELSKRLDLLKECIGVVKALKDLKI